MFNVISPFGRVIAYEPEDRKGFFVHPKSDSAPDGWTPGVDPETGRPTLPGDPSGTKPYKFLGNGRGEGWRCSFSPGDFFYGEIDWVGKIKREETPHRGRHRLSYHGPTSRYFGSDAFRYGSDDKHNNIYCEGLCITVAPFPVLGACLKSIEIPDSETEANPAIKEWWVLCMCKDGTKDVMYKRKFRSGVLGSGYTDEFRARQMRLFDEEKNPDGWVHVGQVELLTSGQGNSCEVFEARAPWFFNASGSYASCVRECEIKFNVNDTIGEDTHKGHALFTVSIDEQAVGFTHQDRGNDPPYQLEVTSIVKTCPQRTSVTRFPWSGGPLVEHVWDAYYLEQEWFGSGSQIVAVDYVEDSEVLAKATLDIGRSNYLGTLYGADAVPHPASTEENPVSSNFQSQVGDLYTYYMEGVDLDYRRDKLPQNENSIIWTKTKEGLALQIIGADTGVVNHWLRRSLSGTRTEFLTGVTDPDDYTLFYTFHRRIYPHYISLRQPHACVFVEDKTYEGYYADTVYENVSEQYYVGGAEYEPISEKQGARSTIYNSTSRPISVLAVVNDMDHDVLVSRSINSYSGEWDARIFDGWPERNPSPLIFDPRLSGAWNEYTKPLHAFLHSEDNDRPCGFAEDDFGNKIASLEYRDHKDEIKTFNRLTDGSAEALTKASGENIKFFPLGAS